MNEHWVRWLWSSLGSHVRKALNDTVFVQGEYNLATIAEGYKVRYLGPDFNYESGGSVNLTLKINISITSKQDPNDNTNHQKRIGKALTCFTKCIPVKRLGEFDMDDQRLVCGLLIQTPIMLTDLIPYDAVSKTSTSTIEATYMGQLEGD